MNHVWNRSDSMSILRDNMRRVLMGLKSGNFPPRIIKGKYTSQKGDYISMESGLESLESDGICYWKVVWRPIGKRFSVAVESDLVA